MSSLSGQAPRATQGISTSTPSPAPNLGAWTSVPNSAAALRRSAAGSRHPGGSGDPSSAGLGGSRRPPPNEFTPEPPLRPFPTYGAAGAHGTSGPLVLGHKNCHRHSVAATGLCMARMASHQALRRIDPALRNSCQFKTVVGSCWLQNNKKKPPGHRPHHLPSMYHVIPLQCQDPVKPGPLPQ